MRPPGNIRRGRLSSMDLTFSGEVWHWRGPAPYFFVTVPPEQSADLRAAARLLTYGWGVIPVRVRLGATEWTTSLFPKGELYLVPIRKAVRLAENVEEGDTVALRLSAG